jgi:predicted PurR-regulated permease PerM
MRPPRLFRSAPTTVSVPTGLAIATAWSWRFLVIAAATAGALLLLVQMSFIVVPILVAILLTGLVAPLAQLLRRWRWPGWLATLTALLALISTLTGLVWLVVVEIVRDWPSLQRRSVIAYEDFVDFLLQSPLQVTEAQLTEWVDALIIEFNLNSAWLLSGALSIGSTAGSLVVGTGIAIFALIFFIHEGGRIWRFIVNLLPREAQPVVAGASAHGWLTLTNFVKVQIFVAFVDAVGIGLGALFLQLPLVVLIFVAVFLGSFVPIVGALATGALAVFIALVYQGPVAALIMAIIVLVVQQLESQILQPLVMGAAMKIHPLAVALAVAAGGFLAGIPGVLFAVPIVAYLNVFISYLANKRWMNDPVATDWLSGRKVTFE